MFALVSLPFGAALVSPPSFRRWGLASPPIAAADVVNVLGRWDRCRDWDTIGQLREMDKLFDTAGNPKRALPTLNPTFATLYTGQGSAKYDSVAEGRPTRYLQADPRVAPSPQRRGFCLRQGLVQRYWHAQNVPLLRFRSQALAASVGLTVAELDARPINPEAADLCFDALARSRSGVLARELCDQRRATYQTADGAFDARRFASNLMRYRLNVAKGYAPIGVLGGALFVKLNGAQQLADYSADSMAKVGENGELWARALGL